MTDYIDRQAAIDAVRGRFSMPVDNLIVEVIGALPSAEVEPVKRGKWIKNDGKNGWHCSMCQEDDLYAFSWNSDTGRYDFQDRYCPNCGAKMMETEA